MQAAASGGVGGGVMRGEEGKGGAEAEEESGPLQVRRATRLWSPTARQRTPLPHAVGSRVGCGAYEARGVARLRQPPPLRARARVKGLAPRSARANKLSGGSEAPRPEAASAPCAPRKPRARSPHSALPFRHGANAVPGTGRGAHPLARRPSPAAP